MIWNMIIDNYEGNERNKTAQKGPYQACNDNEAFDATKLEDVPEWVK